MLNFKKDMTAIELAGQLPELIRASRSTSLIEYTKATRVEPIVLVDRRAAHLPYVDDVLLTGLNIFCGYYLQAVALSVNVGNVDVIKLLDSLNPKRDPLDSLASGQWAKMVKTSMESMVLPLPGEAMLTQGKNVYSHEAYKSGPVGPVGAGKIMSEDGNLSVGKMIEVKVEDDGKEATFPIMVRLISNIIPSDVLSHILSLSSKDSSIKERWHKWRSGQINFINDLILCQDLIDQHKKSLMSDKSGHYKAQVKGRKGNRMSAVLSGNPSVATASSLFVLTTETAEELEKSIRGRLKNFKDREKLFENTSGMMMFVIDPDWEVVTIYHRSIEESSSVSIKEMQRKGKTKGPDILEMLKAFQQNKSPSF